ELGAELDKAGSSEGSLATAWREMTNQDIAARIVGYIRQAAIGDPLVPYDQRVDGALQKLLASRQWSTPQRQWLQKIAAQTKANMLVDRETPGAHLGAHLVGPCHAADPRMCGLCPAPCLAHVHAAPPGAGPGPALDPHPAPLHNRHAEQTVQRAPPPPSAQCWPCPSALTAGHHPALRWCAITGEQPVPDAGYGA